MSDLTSVKKHVGNIQRFLLVALFMLVTIMAQAQGKAVTGTVTDQTGEAVIGATVMVKGTSNGTATDIDGKYELQNVAPNAKLEIRYVGYTPVTVDVKGQSVIDVVMKEDAANLDELVVVGYGVQRKSDLIYYNRTFAEKHRLNITLLQSASSYHYENSDMRANVATPDEKWWNMSSSNDLKSYGTGLSEYKMTSYMARVNYGFDDRYMITASMRWDGSSVLAKGHKWASFPSVALAWRINKEKFLRDVDWISQMKIRAGFGITGNAAVNPYQTLA